MPARIVSASCGLGAIQRTWDVHGRGGKLHVGRDGRVREADNSQVTDVAIHDSPAHSIDLDLGAAHINHQWLRGGRSTDDELDLRTGWTTNAPTALFEL